MACGPCGGVIPPCQCWHRPAVPRAEDVFEHRPLKARVVGHHSAFRIGQKIGQIFGAWGWIGPNALKCKPCLHGAIVQRIARQYHFRGRVFGVTIHTGLSKVDGRTSFKVDVKAHESYPQVNWGGFVPPRRNSIVPSCIETYTRWSCTNFFGDYVEVILCSACAAECRVVL